MTVSESFGPPGWLRPFFDTNVLLYAVSEDYGRAEAARALLAEGGFVSAQVLNEFVAIARGKLKKPWPETREKLRDLRAFCDEVFPLTVETHEAAVRIAERYGYRIYDALILASAIEGGCDVVYSEDMQDGQVVDGVMIRNPFVGV